MLKSSSPDWLIANSANDRPANVLVRRGVRPAIWGAAGCNPLPAAAWISTPRKNVPLAVWRPSAGLRMNEYRSVAPAASVPLRGADRNWPELPRSPVKGRTVGLGE